MEALGCDNQTERGKYGEVLQTSSQPQTGPRSVCFSAPLSNEYTQRANLDRTGQSKTQPKQRLL